MSLRHVQKWNENFSFKKKKMMLHNKTMTSFTSKKNNVFNMTAKKLPKLEQLVNFHFLIVFSVIQ